MFTGHIPEDNALVIDMSAAFGWTGSSGSYGILGGAVAHIHGSTVNASHPDGFYNYHWVDDHVNVASDVGTNCAEIDRSLRWAMTTVMGTAAVNEDKFTTWSTRLKVLGLIFDTVAGSVAMPQTKVNKAQRLVNDAFHAASMTRSEYRSLLGSLRHVATCIRPARAFLQRLRAGERFLGRIRRLRQPCATTSSGGGTFYMNGVPLEYFDNSPAHDFTIITDAYDTGLCATIPSLRLSLTYEFPPSERALIRAFNQGSANEFDTNYRELLACAFAASAWGSRLRSLRPEAAVPTPTSASTTLPPCRGR